MKFFRDTKVSPKVHIEVQRCWIAKIFLSKKSNSGDITKPDFKLYYRAIEIKTAGYWLKKKTWYTWKSIEQNRRHRHKHILPQPFDFWQRSPKIFVQEKTYSSTNGVEKNEYQPLEDWNKIPASHLLLVSIQSGSNTLVKDLKWWN
jgi:hypothetical protein